MKNLNIEVVYTWEDEKGTEHKTKASLGGDWNQYGGFKDDLSEIMPLTESLNEVANDYIVNNCEEDEDDN